MSEKAVLSETDISTSYDSIMVQYDPVEGRGNKCSLTKNMEKMQSTAPNISTCRIKWLIL